MTIIGVSGTMFASSVVEAITQTGHLEGHWNFDLGHQNQGGLDISGAENHGRFNSLDILEGGFYNTGKDGKGLALRIPHLLAGSTLLAFQPMSVEKGVPNNESFTISFWFRMITDKAMFAEDIPDADANSLNIIKIFCNGTSINTSAELLFSDVVCDNNENIMMSAGENDEIKVALNSKGAIVSNINMTVDGELVSINLAAPVYSLESQVLENTSEYATWHHYALSYKVKGLLDREKTVVSAAVFIDGEMKGSSRTLFEGNGDQSDTKTRFGLNQSSLGFQQGFFGLLDDIQLYDRELSSYEITCLSQGGSHCVKDLGSATFSGLQGPQGVSVMRSYYAESIEDTKNNNNCLDLDGNVLDGCAVGDWVVEIYDPKTNNRFKKSLGSIKGKKGEAGGKGRFVQDAIIDDRGHLTINTVFSKGACMGYLPTGECEIRCDAETCSAENYEYDLGRVKGEDIDVPSVPGQAVTDLTIVKNTNNQTFLETRWQDNTTQQVAITLPQDAVAQECTQTTGFDGVDVRNVRWIKAENDEGGELVFDVYTMVGFKADGTKDYQIETLRKTFGKGDDGDPSTPILVADNLPESLACPSTASLNGRDGIHVDNITFENGILTVDKRNADNKSFTIVPTDKLTDYAGANTQDADKTQVKLVPYVGSSAPSAPAGYSCLTLQGHTFFNSNKRRYLLVCEK